MRGNRVPAVVLTLTVACGWTGHARADDAVSREAKHYRIEDIAAPDDAHLEVGGLDFSPDRTLYVATRRGEVWTLRPDREGAARAWKLFASGLHEILGVLVEKNGQILVAQRPELTRIRDRDRDGRGDSFETLTQDFGISGNYHEYHFGPVRDREGNLYGTLNVGWTGHGASVVPFRGWAYKLTPDGKFLPFASGLRSPAGIGISPDGELFVTDNQGDWWATSPLLHIRQGEFFGHPAGLIWEQGYQGPDDGFKIPVETLTARRRLPALWFVYGPLGHSPTEPVWDTSAGKFGPFAGQMLVGDQTRSLIVRVALEKIQGEFQGVAIPFRHGFASGIVRMRFGPDGALYVGGTDRGWGAVGGKPFALQRLVYTGKPPFEMQTVSLREDGFHVRFTRPIDPTAAARSSAYGITHHGYRYWKTYGSPHIETTQVSPTRVAVDADGMGVHVVMPTLVEGRVYTLKLAGVVSAEREALLHDTAYYTLNHRRLPPAAQLGGPR